MAFETPTWTVVAPLIQLKDKSCSDCTRVAVVHFLTRLGRFVLQGLGLSVDENFAVVDECFPYIARRMLSDDDPRIRESLRTFIYNGEDRLDVEKLEVLPPPFCPPFPFHPLFSLAASCVSG